MEVITHLRVIRILLQRRVSCQQSVIVWNVVHLYSTSLAISLRIRGLYRTSINYLNLFSGGKEEFLLRAMTDDADEIKVDQLRDAHMLLRLIGIICYPELQRSPVKVACTCILSRAGTLGLFSESFHHWGREAVQSFPAQPFCRAPSGFGPPTVPGRGLDPVQVQSAGRASETQGHLQ